MVPKLLWAGALVYSLMLLLGLVSLIPQSGVSRDVPDGIDDASYCIVGEYYASNDSFVTGVPASGRVISDETERTFCIAKSKASVSIVLIDLLRWLPMQATILGLIVVAGRVTSRYPDPFTAQAAAAVRRLAWWCCVLLLVVGWVQAVGSLLLVDRLAQSGDYYPDDINVWPAVVVAVALLLAAGVMDAAAERLDSTAQAKA